MANYSFWDLISEHFVEIPIIQRDYAQGRDTPKSNEIRKSFVESIVRATKENDTNLHLNFVYGKVRGPLDAKKVEENKKAIEAMLKSVRGYSQSLELDFNYIWGKDNTTRSITSFLPLDGQQRLTTLFLFHWYILRRRGINQDESTTLLNFSYKIRPSTKQFCIELVKSNIEIEHSSSLSDVIEDSNWFFKYWLKDPSVSGMLRMLNEIHRQCSTFTPEDIETIWVNLTNKKSVNFELLDLDKFELTDELYVKMNARGKALTSFENFKSSLMEFIENKNINIDITDWKDKIDTSWADLFWDNKDDENMLIDEEYYLYFRNMMQLQFTLFNDLTVEQIENTTNFQLLAPRREKKNKSAFYKEYQIIPLNQLDEIGILTQDNLNQIFNILNYLSNYKKNDADAYSCVKGIFKNFITGDISYPDKIQFFALMQYLLVSKGKASNSQLDEFLRVVENLANNTVIDSVPIVKNIVDGLAKDSIYFNDFTTSIQDKISFSGFRTDQVHEEKLKMLLRLKEDSTWNNLINEAEAHKYFQGQIGFLFHLTSIDTYYTEHSNLNFTIEDNNNFKQVFKEYLVVAKQTFKDIYIDKGTNQLLNRVLLTYGDYLIPYASYRSFPKADKHRDNSWYRILREFKSENKYSKIWKVLKLLFDDLKLGTTLEDIVKNIPTDWRECFVEYPETLDRCGKYQHFRVEGKTIYLLSKDTKRSDYSELKTFHLFKSKFESNMNDYTPFNNTEYHEGSNKSGKAYAYLNEFKISGFDIKLNVYHDGNKDSSWEIRVVANDKDILKLNTMLDPILIQANDFILEVDPIKYSTPSYILKLDGNISSVNDTIKNICSGLSQMISDGD